MIIITNSTEETEKIGIELSAKLKGGNIVLLSGNLGAGKTALVKGIAKGFGIKNTITSPTFTLMNLYPVNHSQSTIKQLVHIDTYRLKNEHELIEIGAEDYLGKPNTICLIEWPDKIEELLKNYNQKDSVSIEIKQLENSNEREIILNSPN
jgi:tRNA threonylcarbamoyladenosine biosynthesis protein TsaE